MSTSGAEVLRQVKSQIERSTRPGPRADRTRAPSLIDVRETEEFATGHLPGARSIPRHLEPRIEGVRPGPRRRRDPLLPVRESARPGRRGR